MLDVNMFDQLKIRLATADQIRNWSHGEVKKPETINYRTLRPEKDGLFCEKIFGPTRDWECYCGKYKSVRFKGIICERCGVEVTRSKVRRDRMGHIELAAPAVHIWYLRGTRSWLAYLLAGIEPKEELKAKQLEKVIYFAAHLVSWVDEDARHEALTNLEAEYLEERDAIQKEMELAIDRRFKELEETAAEAEKEDAKAADLKKLQKEADKEVEAIRERYEIELDLIARTWDEFKSLHARKIIEDEMLWREMRDKYGEYFEGGTGAEAIKALIDRIDFDEEETKLRDAIDPGDSGRKPLSAQRKQKAIKRLKIVASFNRRDEHGRRTNDPKAMILDSVPVIPPELRPMVQLDGGRFATSDLNDLYRRVINRNNRLERLLSLGAPEIIVNNEKRMLQEAVDALFDNGRRGRPVTGPGNRPLKSLSDMLKGKQGRFRQNLLGKRVDYSGRSVIVVGPHLKFYQCGLPKTMALELFKPFVMRKLVADGIVHNIKSAKRLIEKMKPEVWPVVEHVIKEHPVLLNSAPTLHRLGIQAFEPVLVEGKAIKLHPLVCPPYNADFDGDQMAVHVPLSVEAQAESRFLMLSVNNILAPKDGEPITLPSQDMILGAYYLTIKREEMDQYQTNKIYKDFNEMYMAYQNEYVKLHSIVKVRRYSEATGKSKLVESTVGRFIFNENIPQDLGFVDREKEPYALEVDFRAGKKQLADIVARCFHKHQNIITSQVLDHIKDLGFKYATKVAISISLSDMEIPKEKAKFIADTHKLVDKYQDAYLRGLISNEERYNKIIEKWSETTENVTDALMDHLSDMNNVNIMAKSGARGSRSQIRQLAGMRGLMANAVGKTVEIPITSNFREGLSVLEYFISTTGARKGLADTALRTADSGYLTRRLVDVSQDVIVREEDCGATTGVEMVAFKSGKSGQEMIEPLYDRIVGRFSIEDICNPESGEIIVKEGEMITADFAERIIDSGIDKVFVRSVLHCKAEHGVCAKCYGLNLATGKPVHIGEAVGIIADQ